MVVEGVVDNPLDMINSRLNLTLIHHLWTCFVYVCVFLVFLNEKGIWQRDKGE